MNILNYFSEKQEKAEYCRALRDANDAYSTRILDDCIAILCEGICIKTVPLTMTYEDVEKILAEYRLCATNYIKRVYGKA